MWLPRSPAIMRRCQKQGTSTSADMAMSLGNCRRTNFAETAKIEELDSAALGTGSCERESRDLSVLVRLGSVRIFGRLVHVRGAVFIQLGIRKIEMGIGGMVFSGGQFTVKPVRTNVRRILIADATGVERVVRNRQSKFARLCLRLSNGESVFAHRRLRLEADELNDDLRRHFAPGEDPAAAAITATVFLTRLARLRFGGVPSAISTTMMLVTNFFTPCRSKSIEVRS